MAWIHPDGNGRKLLQKIAKETKADRSLWQKRPFGFSFVRVTHGAARDGNSKSITARLLVRTFYLRWRGSLGSDRAVKLLGAVEVGVRSLPDAVGIRRIGEEGLPLDWWR